MVQGKENKEGKMKNINQSLTGFPEGDNREKMGEETF